LIGGSTTGIGLAIAETFAREGARLVLCGRDANRFANAHKTLAQYQPDTIMVAADLATSEGVSHALQAAMSAFGSVDVLVTNTGGPPPGPFESHSSIAWDNAISLLLKSAVELVQGVLPGMRNKGWGRIVGITSMAVKQPARNLVLSNSIRAAVTGFLRTLANEVAQDRITVNTVLPGFTDTARLAVLATAMNEPQGVVFEKWRQMIPLGRLGRPEEIAETVAFLASEQAGYITGQAILVDGGYVQSLY
jgi:3-oxoacyl-[acyl-carrier protein] reductase